MKRDEYLAIALGLAILSGGALHLREMRAIDNLSADISHSFEVTSIEARLLAKCGDKVYAAMEEDQFPAPCDWVEPIKFEESPQ